MTAKASAACLPGSLEGSRMREPEIRNPTACNSAMATDTEGRIRRRRLSTRMPTHPMCGMPTGSAMRRALASSTTAGRPAPLPEPAFPPRRRPGNILLSGVGVDRPRILKRSPAGSGGAVEQPAPDTYLGQG